MSEREFKVQTLRTPGQWNAGRHSRLRVGQEGLTLFSAPDFDRMLPILGVSDIAVSSQGELFWAELCGDVWQLVRSSNSGCQREVLLSLSSCGLVAPSRLWWTPRHVWVFDGPSARILGFALGSFQVTREIHVDGRLIDADISKAPGVETVYALVESDGQFQVRIYPAPPGQESMVTSDQLGQPMAIATAADGTVVIYDALCERFLHLKDGEINVSRRQPELQNFNAVAMETDPSGAIYLASNKGELKLFDPDGWFLMQVKLPSSVTSIRGMGFDAAGGFYLASNAGIALFGLAKVPVGLAGTLYTPVLDNGKIQGTWHGVSLLAQLPAKSGVEVAYYAFDDENFKKDYTQRLSTSSPVASQAADIESFMQTPAPEKSLWSTDTGQFTGNGADQNQLDMMFVAHRGRYLVLRIRLTAYDASSHPSISQLQVRYPRISLLRYLPPVYQEDPISAAFLERFLSLFETIFQEVDIKISDLYQYFDPATTPPDFLAWLASWLSLPLDDGLPEARKRALIAEAPILLRTKGTPSSIQRFLHLCTGADVQVREPSLLAAPFLAGEVKLGEGSILASRASGALHIGDDTVLGEALLVSGATTAAAPLAAVANRFEITLDMEPAVFAAQQPAIHRAIRDFIPANTDWTLRVAPSDPGIGGARLGMNARVAALRPFRVGFSPLGTGRALGSGLGRDIPAPCLERGVAVTPDWRLIE